MTNGTIPVNHIVYITLLALEVIIVIACHCIYGFRYLNFKNKSKKYSFHTNPQSQSILRYLLMCYHIIANRIYNLLFLSLIVCVLYEWIFCQFEHSIYLFFFSILMSCVVIFFISIQIFGDPYYSKEWIQEIQAEYLELQEEA